MILVLTSKASKDILYMQQDFLLINTWFFRLQQDARMKFRFVEVSRKPVPPHQKKRILFCAHHFNPPKVIFGNEKCTGEKVHKLLKRLIANIKLL